MTVNQAIKYFPFHMKLANLLSDLSEKTGQFNAAPLSFVLTSLNQNLPYLVSKSK